MARDTLYAIGEALIDMIPSRSGCAFSDVLTYAPCRRLRAVGDAPAWGCKTLPVQNIFAWNVHFLPNVTF